MYSKDYVLKYKVNFTHLFHQNIYIYIYFIVSDPKLLSSVDTKLNKINEEKFIENNLCKLKNFHHVFFRSCGLEILKQLVRH